MGEVGIFLRKATGLVREAGLFDVVSLFVIWSAPSLGLYYLTTWGLWAAPHGEILTAILISSVFLVGAGLCWAFMGATIPRSGGDYIFVSRIIHPAFGFAFSVGSVTAWLGWCYMIAAWTSEYALPTFFETMGYPEYTEIFLRPEVMYIIATIVLAFCTLIAILRSKWFFKSMDIFFLISTISMAAALGTLALTGREGFIQAFNSLAEESGSPLRYENLIEYANSYALENYGFPIDAPINFYHTLMLIPAVWWTFAYVEGPAWVAGEIKEVRRNIILGNIIGIIFFIGSFLIGTAIIYNTIGREWMAAAVYAMEMPEWADYLPISEANYVTLAAICTDNIALRFLIGINYVVVCIAWVLQCIAVPPRAILAWAMDRVVPSWMGDVHPRWRTPYKAIIFLWILSQILLVGYVLAPGILGALYVMVWENLTAFSGVALCCILLPFLKKVRHIWETSPVKWHFGPIPVMFITGLIYLFACLSTTFFFLINPELGEYHPPSWIGLSIIAVIGAIVWLTARWYRKKTLGIDIAEAYAEIPPA